MFTFDNYIIIILIDIYILKNNFSKLHAIFYKILYYNILKNDISSFPNSH